jgi:hypothetical protein
MKTLEQFDPNEAKKTLLGNYASQRMQSLANLLKLYQQNNIYVAEEASNLVTFVTYEM